MGHVLGEGNGNPNTQSESCSSGNAVVGPLDFSSSRKVRVGTNTEVANLSITTFNVLAPIFKRVGSGRESEFRGAYLERHAAILEHLKVRDRKINN